MSSMSNKLLRVQLRIYTLIFLFFGLNHLERAHDTTHAILLLVFIEEHALGAVVDPVLDAHGAILRDGPVGRHVTMARRRRLVHELSTAIRVIDHRLNVGNVRGMFLKLEMR